ncbi:MAG: DUF2267 domain-containing protein [Deltaproteobacteria bacterium]|nr:DUF2267 domain-containing protein [Deltaproteobacteria bacterium]
MPMPGEYENASRDFDSFIEDAKQESLLQTSHQTYTMVQSVFQAFRRRLSVNDAIRFANVLPAVARALFVADWDPDEPQKPFEDLEAMTRDVRTLRPNHNVSPDTAIHDVSVALRKHVRADTFDVLLASLPAGAAEFWRV